ncbi:hypothetical protein EON64_12940, partial [archaeon]
EQPLYISGAKANFGHMEAAAGMLGLFAVLSSFQHLQVAPNACLSSTNAKIKLPTNGSIILPTALTPFGSSRSSLYAAISSFGYSGTIAHIILAAHPSSPRPHVRTRPFVRYNAVASCAPKTSPVPHFPDAPCSTPLVTCCGCQEDWVSGRTVAKWNVVKRNCALGVFLEVVLETAVLQYGNLPCIVLTGVDIKNCELQSNQCELVSTIDQFGLVSVYCQSKEALIVQRVRRSTLIQASQVSSGDLIQLDAFVQQSELASEVIVRLLDCIVRQVAEEIGRGASLSDSSRFSVETLEADVFLLSKAQLLAVTAQVLRVNKSSEVVFNCIVKGDNQEVLLWLQGCTYRLELSKNEDVGVMSCESLPVASEVTALIERSRCLIHDFLCLEGEVSEDDDLMGLGVDSLVATECSLRLSEELGVDLEPLVVMEARSVRGIIGAILAASLPPLSICASTESAEEYNAWFTHIPASESHTR